MVDVVVVGVPTRDRVANLQFSTRGIFLILRWNDIGRDLVLGNLLPSRPHSTLSVPDNPCQTFRMNKLLILPVLLLTLLVGTPAFSADFQKGLTAAQSGDYATALREWEPLAKQENAVVQNVLGVMYDKGHGVPRDDKTALKW